MKKEITVTRKTQESNVSVHINLGKRDPSLKKNISTSMEFFNHMLETLAWRACMNLSVKLNLESYKLTHLICEDVGLTFGEGFGDLVENNIPSGINGNGFSISGIDEALARAVLSMEGRSLLFFTHQGIPLEERVEDILSSDLTGFLGGFTQGAGAILHIDILKGKNTHHIWESVFRALGESMRNVMEACSWRQDAACGVKGKVVIEKK